jgi:phage tail sheath protein FI
MTLPGTDGEELTDYDVVGSNRQGTGIFALERTQGVDLLCIPAAPSADRGTTAFLAAERFCEKHRAILIWDPPAAWVTALTAVIGIRNGSYSSHNAMTYFPRIRARGESMRFSSGLPACGAVAGLLARRDSCGIWQAEQAAPGSLRASLTPVLGLQESEVTLLKRCGVNAFAAKGGTSVLTGNSTLDGVNSLSKFWQRLDRRRLLFFILKSIEGATRWACEPSRSDTTVKQLERQVRVFFTGLYEQGALAGKTAAQTFFLRATQNTSGEPSIILRFGFALHAPSEFLIYEIRYAPDGMAIHHLPTLEAEQLLL